MVLPKWNVVLTKITWNVFARFLHAVASVTKQCNSPTGDRALQAMHGPTFSVLGCCSLAARAGTFGFPITNIYATSFRDCCNVVAMPSQNSLYVVLTSCRRLYATTSLCFSNGRKSLVTFFYTFMYTLCIFRVVIGNDCRVL